MRRPDPLAGRAIALPRSLEVGASPGSGRLQSAGHVLVPSAHCPYKIGQWFGTCPEAVAAAIMRRSQGHDPDRNGSWSVFLCMVGMCMWCAVDNTSTGKQCGACGARITLARATLSDCCASASRDSRSSIRLLVMRPHSHRPDVLNRVLHLRIANHCPGSLSVCRPSSNEGGNSSEQWNVQNGQQPYWSCTTTCPVAIL